MNDSEDAVHHREVDLSRIEAPSTHKTYVICAFAAFGGICFGYQTAVMSGLLGTPYFIEFHKALMTSILACGVLVGALVAGDMADTFGRRKNVILGSLVLCVGNALQMCAEHHVVLFVLGRLIAGLGLGFISAVIVMYISEIAPKRCRGAFIAAYQFCISLGVLLANSAVYSAEGRDDSGAYRIPIGVQFLWAMILGVGLAVLPESPRYLIKKGRISEAKRALARVRGQPLDSECVQDEIAELVASREYELYLIPRTSYIGSWLLCSKGPIRNGSSPIRRTILGMSIQMMQQLTGINFIFYFGVTFFQQLGSVDNPFLIALIFTLVNVCSTPISFFTIDRFGRRPLLIYGAIGMIVIQFMIACIGITEGRRDQKNLFAVRAMIALICMNIFCFAITWGPTAWVVVGESFSLPMRSRGIGISTASNWFWNCVIATCTPFLVGGDKGEANLGPKIFFILGSTCCLSLAFAYFLVPEMKDLSLEQIEMMMDESSPRCSPAYRVLKGFTQMRGDRVLRQMRSVSADCESSKLTPRSHVVEEGGR
ncbi:high-affinity glucose transporter RGT2 [Verticillium dahliae VdLs.17]|uniref:High-affinity glucose transporter RGT2 n=1 Tax=Verticillium dahliae (strain VdLs.17 / ATCC MYA-4575 / FGSC 10137) TaxID=498257 RepID=G2WQD8_VERDV|nr:high-affinity glucose transporter RGT2 [Verticillium dahliae VdLs.17]EGY13898.1 high-affinity glucose transporter RGT2 [Verticillium dahliae VdLs.17]KAH6710368.1 high-affinity glucose transporter RGT2 [Verticillium dahliae]